MPVETKTVPFNVLNAFTNSVAGGNPAAVVFIPPGSFSTFTDEALLTIAKNLNQPITTFVSPAAALFESAPESATFDTRWFTPCREVPMCGHGTLAAAQAILTQGSLVSQSVTTLRFVSSKGRVAVARRVEDSKIEIALDAGSVTEVTGADAAKLRTVLARALGEDIEIRFTGRGDSNYAQYVLVDVDGTDLATLEVNTHALLDSPFTVHVLTTPSNDDSNVAFHSRMFAPSAGISEDHVCGTAHCLAGPYWKQKKQLTGVMMAKQVSSRGGDLRVLVDEEEGLVRLAGQVTAVLKEELFL
ncbi:hypothetical protein EW146_g6303 [Bondarzewia mesenterica]|uniref:Uncharacterized protein n=1 Tax=Bondarzewia mesenterica TaxID=1095465 RepID=A0A4S4LQV1_9AGAM|nr:hypothetical protein EW146_g6303 [Bondarzewia mesenterica]